MNQHALWADAADADTDLECDSRLKAHVHVEHGDQFSMLSLGGQRRLLWVTGVGFGPVSVRDRMPSSFDGALAALEVGCPNSWGGSAGDWNNADPAVWGIYSILRDQGGTPHLEGFDAIVRSIQTSVTASISALNTRIELGPPLSPARNLQAQSILRARAWTFGGEAGVLNVAKLVSSCSPNLLSVLLDSNAALSAIARGQGLYRVWTALGWRKAHLRRWLENSQEPAVATTHPKSVARVLTFCGSIKKYFVSFEEGVLLEALAQRLPMNVRVWAIEQTQSPRGLRATLTTSRVLFDLFQTDGCATAELGAALPRLDRETVAALARHITSKEDECRSTFVDSYRAKLQSVLNAWHALVGQSHGFQIRGWNAPLSIADILAFGVRFSFCTRAGDAVVDHPLKGRLFLHSESNGLQAAVIVGEWRIAEIRGPGNAHVDAATKRDLQGMLDTLSSKPDAMALNRLLNGLRQDYQRHRLSCAINAHPLARNLLGPCVARSAQA